MSDYVTEPLRGVAAFRDRTRLAYFSQAAQLLILGLDLRGDRFLLQRDVETDDYEALGVPHIENDGRRFSREDIHERLLLQFPIRPGDFTVEIEQIDQVAQRFYQLPSLLTSAQLFEACVSSSSELVRVAAAASYYDLAMEPSGLVAVLENGTRSTDPLVMKLAATVLARIDPENQHLIELTRAHFSGGEPSPLHTSLLVHGTWAKTELWWQPRGGFHTYILNNVLNDLYAAADRFDWSGGYSDAARSLAGVDLANWLIAHKAEGVNLITHSHGGNVAMLASHTSGIPINKMVLLSCPVHMPKYVPNFSMISKVVSLRVKGDLVILADRGGQRFRHPQIQEHVLPIWYDHSATHDEAVWKTYNLPALL